MQIENHTQPEQKNDPNMFWEGFYLVSFFIFFIIVGIPAAPKSVTFDGNYDISMITFGLAGLAIGRLSFLIMRNWPEWIKFALHVGIYGSILWYLVNNIDKFTIPW
jgi:hypothetical protein